MSESVKKAKLRFLHVTDCHLTESKNAKKEDTTVETKDLKINVDEVDQPKKKELLQETLRSLVKKLQSQENGEGQLDAVIFSGDGTLKGDPGGQLSLRNILIEELKLVGITNKNIIATPGNHDIVSGSKPSDPARYEHFKTAWMDTEPVVVPFLDGIHKRDSLNPLDHVLKSPDGEWAIFPINSSNWSQLTIPDHGNAEVALLREHFKSNPDPKLSKALEKLCKYDMARISDDQLRALKELAEDAKGVRLKIAVLHHHLLPVDTREEFKAFADITNLGHLRQVLRELGFHLVVHGHKHVTAAYYDHIYPDKLESAPAHRILTISGGTFGPTGQHPDNPLRLIEIDETPYAPICRIINIGSVKPGRELEIAESEPYRLWEDDPASKGPAIIYGTTIDDVYARVIQTVKLDPERIIICTVDFQLEERMPVPLNYPYRSGKNHDEKCNWFEETVLWWQIPASKIETRIPYLHGSRLQRFGGGLDQIARVVSLLKDGNTTSKAIAFVIDPGRDFNDKPFASFCFVQFCLREDKRLDCIGYYRVQEFRHWWPINVAELRYLQLYVAEKVSATAGSITTFTPYPRLSKDSSHPAKVAVPLIDQWVDNYPMRIAKIALTISNSLFDLEDEGYRYWNRCLDDLEQAASHYHGDGVQVSIEGLELLKVWLEAASNNCNSIIKILDELKDTNEAHQNKLHLNAEFKRWQKLVKQKIEELREITKESPNISNQTSLSDRVI